MQSMLQGQARRTTLIGFCSVAVLIGVALAQSGWLVAPLLVLLAMPLLLLCLRRKMLWAVPAVIIVGLLAGLAQGGMVATSVARYGPLIDQKVIVTGTVVQDATYGKRGQRDFMITNIRHDGQRLPGEVRVTTFSSVEPGQGDTVQVSGKAMPGFGGYQLGMYFADVSVLRTGESWVIWLRQYFAAAIRNVIPEPQASLGLGFLLGIKSQLPDELYDQLKVVGLTHIVVASGYNLTILVRVARRLFAERSAYQATLVAGGLMVGFVGVTGLSPSMTRAALVTSLSLIAWYYGRVIHPVVLLLFTAAATGLWNPLYVWGDVGWYLSFLAFGGVMLLAPLAIKRLYGKRDPPALMQIVIETLCAEATTLPLIMLVFGSVSVVGLFANVLIAPLVPLAMLGVFAAGVGWWLLPGYGAWLALPAAWLLTYMVSMVGWLAAIPGAMQPLSLNVVGMVAAYAVVCLMGVVAWRVLRYDYLSKSIVD